MAVGTLEEMIDEDHAIVSTSSGPEYYVPVMSFVDKDLLEPGCTVLLHHKTHAVVGVLQDDADPMVSVMKLEKAPTESYGDIGGLDQQIQEIKVRRRCLTIDVLVLSVVFCPGSGRVTAHSPRVIRGDGYQATKRSHSLWRPWNGKNAACKGCCKLNFRHILASHG
jgi:coenzyme F420-reducing hydrogenase gamma subunit